MRLVITGVPGTGKTSVAEILSERTGYPLITTGDVVKDKYVDTRKLRLKTIWKTKDMGDVIIEGHLFCEVKLPADLVIVLRTHPEELKRRLEARGYPEKKIRENVLAEILDYCIVKAEQKYDDVWQVDTTGRTPLETAERILSALERGVDIYDRVDWSHVLEDWLRKGYI
ncbi:MAG TPA: kinase [Euryarchaeota archaeon]|nr:kinase [Euryarchaeota archaeon]